jgi:hypothetical protein
MLRSLLNASAPARGRAAPGSAAQRPRGVRCRASGPSRPGATPIGALSGSGDARGDPAGVQRRFVLVAQLAALAAAG